LLAVPSRAAASPPLFLELGRSGFGAKSTSGNSIWIPESREDFDNLSKDTDFDLGFSTGNQLDVHHGRVDARDRVHRLRRWMLAAPALI
jgi:hypothetical protein